MNRIRAQGCLLQSFVGLLHEVTGLRLKKRAEFEFLVLND
jgi:hypothetical protein